MEVFRNKTNGVSDFGLFVVLQKRNDNTTTKPVTTSANNTTTPTTQKKDETVSMEGWSKKKGTPNCNLSIKVLTIAIFQRGTHVAF